MVGENMKIYVELKDDNYVKSWSSSRSNDDDKEVEVDDEHKVLSNPEIFRYEDGELKKDKDKKEELKKEREKEENKPSDIEMLQDSISELGKRISELEDES